MWGKIIIPMYRLWLNGLYGLYGPRCPLSSKRPINLISLSLSIVMDLQNDFMGNWMISNTFYMPNWLWWQITLAMFLLGDRELYINIKKICLGFHICSHLLKVLRILIWFTIFRNVCEFSLYSSVQPVRPECCHHCIYSCPSSLWCKAIFRLNADYTLIARFMGPTWGPSGANRTQVGPMLAPWTLLSG